MAILDQITSSAVRVDYSSFSPQTTSEMFALRLATKLRDKDAARHYAKLAEQYATAHLLTAYHRAADHCRNGNLARRFHEELDPLKHRDTQSAGIGKGHKVAAIRIDRRAVAVAVLDSDHLAHAQARQLSSSPGKAISSAAAFIERILEKFYIKSVVLEAIPNGHEKQRKVLQHAIIDVLTHEEIDPGEISKSDLFAAFAHPPVSSRKELREIASSIWPILDEQPGSPWTHDAAMLGLYVQIEALFDNHN